VQAVFDPRVPISVLCPPSSLVTLTSMLLESAPEGAAGITLYVFEADDPHACILRFELLGASCAPLPPEAAELSARLGGESGASQPWFTIAAYRPSPLTTPHEDQLGKGLSVLVVEDNLINQRVAEECLRHLGTSCRMVNNGQEAVSLVRVEDFDLILMDVHMPVMDGLAATREIRTLPGTKRPYISALTAFALPGDREKCFDAGMDDYLTKPCRVEILAGLLAKVSARKKTLPGRL
jgi:CheY-like chemotaxis protein